MLVLDKRGLVMRFGKWMLAAMCLVASVAAGGQTGPAHLQVDNLDKPLGIDDPAPRFSWQLHDAAQGAKQTAYRVMVSTRSDLLGTPDVWDSGKVESGQSLNVKYAGPAVKASTRYFWRVEAWDKDGKAYPASEATWWETGLLKQDAWKGEWIGWETAEEAAERKAPAKWIASPEAKPGKPDSEQKFAYRAVLNVNKPVKQAVLFATAEDTVSAWVDGEKVMTGAEFPPYHHLPWKKFVRADVTAQVTQGKNTIAVESVHYIDKYGEKDRKDAPPMIATVVLLYTDGTSSAVVSDVNWKSSAEPAPGWESNTFDDAAWKNAAMWEQAKDSDAAPVLQPWIPDSVKELRKDFDAGQAVKSARIYATALGTYELFLNGKRVGDSVMAPGWTDYRERVLYQTYDVTEMVRGGSNVLSALLAPGWYSTSLEWLQQPNNYGDTPPALRAQLRIEHADGSVEWVVTDGSWKARPSYILRSELYDGETQDSRIPTPTSVTSGAQTLEPVEIVQPTEIKIEAQDFEPIRVERSLDDPKRTEPKPGVFIYDFGQNMAGVEQLKISGPAGTDVQVRLGEILNPDGTLYTENLRTAKVTDHFLLSGNGQEELVPQFTFHGFRYLEVTGLKTAPDAKDVKALVLHTDFPFTAELKTGNEMVNKLWSNILWGQRSNFVGVPTDCPQRDERLGWSADAQVFWRAASFNADLAPFTRKFAADLRGTQVGTPYYGIYAPGTARPHMGTGAAWSDAGVIIPWTSWIQTGDTMVIDENWQAMRKYVDAIHQSNPDGIWHNNSGTPFGDWLSLEGRTKEDIVATAYWAYDVDMMRQMAHATGRAQEEEHYAQLESKIRNAFEKKFVEAGGYVPGADNSPSPFGDINNPNAKSKAGDTQTGYVLALHMNLLPENLRSAAAGRLVKKIEANHGLLNTGFVGTPYLLEELTKTGHQKLAYDVLLNTGMPSWGYVIEHGGTTTWERWNGDQMIGDPQMNSYNHYAYGAVADWIYRYAAGIDASPLDAGFHTVVLHPVFDPRLSPLEFSYQSSFGQIKSSWTARGSTAEWNVTLPANTTGRLELQPAEAARWRLEGVALNASPLVKKLDGGFELRAGSYRFEVQAVGKH
ncbi:MAG TPA: family 78 glycoside hydrolase catalytic domain [Terracidiphilus sp.]|nr:family 78 glycoside hydrolase catalytic domain [Terracidiphilus sp.]